jgi:hypothetical protein
MSYLSFLQLNHHHLDRLVPGIHAPGLPSPHAGEYRRIRIAR